MVVEAVVVGDDQVAGDVHARRRLEADDIRAEVGEDTRAGGAGEDLGEVDDADAVERQLLLGHQITPWSLRTVRSSFV